MPVFLDGQQNLAALTVPGVYGDIILPSPLLVGTPTNIMGVVGVGSWGPTNALIPISRVVDAALAVGVPKQRNRDIATHIAAATQVGGAIGFLCVRVTDGTDVAASIVVQTSCVTLTAKYTGTLGNSIQFSIQNGTAPNSFMAIVSFPGLPPEQFNNITGSGNTFWVNLATAINNGNATRGPSQFVIASAGAGVAAPTLSTPVTLTGGTDGDSSVTDSTLMGQDTLPRKGMYALRNSRCDAFTLVDMSTSANWAAMVSFGLSELMLPVVATASGTSYSTTNTTRVSAGVDSPWLWIINGDWPTFYDSYNGVSRLVNPTAFALGMLGNLSPQQSPLNKPLQGISATQTSATGQTYSDTDLSLINTGGIDTILPAVQSPGGFYYSFATGRNASSNTAANGIEYTRMTNFLMRTAQSKAAGSFIGRLQSIQANDQTRADAKSLFDGFSAQLASAQVGLGINGQGMIDRPWLVQCDLSNNPPNLQALGYLFLYWQVRYLNVVRYFVVKFAGGGNVNVSVQATPPSPQQFATASNTI